MTMLKNFKFGTALAAVAVMTMGSMTMHASQLSGDARASIPKDVQQIIVVDYKAMLGSSAAMQLKDRVLPPELKRLETALATSGLKVEDLRVDFCFPPVLSDFFRVFESGCSLHR